MPQTFVPNGIPLPLLPLTHLLPRHPGAQSSNRDLLFPPSPVPSHSVSGKLILIFLPIISWLALLFSISNTSTLVEVIMTMCLKYVTDSYQAEMPSPAFISTPFILYLTLCLRHSCHPVIFFFKVFQCISVN